MELKLITEFNESMQYRSKSAIAQTTAREVCDFAFMDLLALWILYNEFEFAPLAIEYAERTATFNRFTNYRQMGTDLYLNLHIITMKRTDLLGTAADATLLDRIELDVPMVVRYLRSISRNTMNPGMARVTLQRLEQGLYIQDSNYRSVRRLVQNWPNLQTVQKRTALTRMLFFYRTHARRSEMFKLLSALAKSQGLVDNSATNPEKPTLATVVATHAAAATAGWAIGSHFGKKLL